MQRECCGNASYEQCKEAMNLDRKIRKGFREEGLREKGDWGHCRAFGVQRSSELLGWDVGGEIHLPLVSTGEGNHLLDPGSGEAGV